MDIFLFEESPDIHIIIRHIYLSFVYGDSIFFSNVDSNDGAHVKYRI